MLDGIFCARVTFERSAPDESQDVDAHTRSLKDADTMQEKNTFVPPKDAILATLSEVAVAVAALLTGQLCVLAV